MLAKTNALVTIFFLLIVAAENPRNPRYSVVVFAGLSAEATVHAPRSWRSNGRPGEVVILPHQGPPQALVLPAPAREGKGSSAGE